MLIDAIKFSERSLKPATCDTDELYVTAMLLATPYWFRFLQCCNRGWNARHDSAQYANPHWYNAGKYISGIAVVAVTTLTKNYTLWVLISAIAGVYMLIWDFLMDWGLPVFELSTWVWIFRLMIDWPVSVFAQLRTVRFISELSRP